ncbi:MAG: hypothetical protein ABWZ52_09625 [Acidimicrobiales bacterium]
MRDLLQALLIAGVAMSVSCVLAVLWVRHRLRRTLRIDPAVRSVAPTLWIVTPTAAARLHRRLRVVAASARLASTCDPGLSPLANELVGEALALEPSVLAVTGTRRAGAAIRRDLSVRIAGLEGVARRLASLSNQPLSAPEANAATRLRDRLSALEAARHELAEIEVRAGLLRHS